MPGYHLLTLGECGYIPLQTYTFRRRASASPHPHNADNRYNKMPTYDLFYFFEYSY